MIDMGGGSMQIAYEITSKVGLQLLLCLYIANHFYLALYTVPGLHNTHGKYLYYKFSRFMTKPTKWHVRPAKTQISLGIHPV